MTSTLFYLFFLSFRLLFGHDPLLPLELDAQPPLPPPASPCTSCTTLRANSAQILSCTFPIWITIKNEKLINYKYNIITFLTIHMSSTFEISLYFKIFFCQDKLCFVVTDDTINLTWNGKVSKHDGLGPKTFISSSANFSAMSSSFSPPLPFFKSFLATFLRANWKKITWYEMINNWKTEELLNIWN